MLCVSQNLMSADRTDRSEDGDSQAEREITLRRVISNDSTKSKLHHTAWEVRVSAVPDFRLHPFSGFGSHIFCQLGQTICQRTDPSKIPLLLAHISCKIRLPQIEVLCGAFFQESDRLPETNALHTLPPHNSKIHNRVRYIYAKIIKFTLYFLIIRWYNSMVRKFRYGGVRR